MQRDQFQLEASDIITSAKLTYMFYGTGFSPAPEKQFALPIVQGEYDQIAKTFDHNLHALLATVSIPATFAIASAYQSHWQRIHTAERIRSLSPTDELEGKNEDERRQIALERARTRMNSFAGSKEGQQRIAEDACHQLVNALEETEVKLASQELLRQGLVLLWGAFEVLSRDLFITYLNSNPSKVSMLSTNPETRTKFELKALKLDLIAEYGFNLSPHMGDILESSNDLSDLATIKSIYKVLFPSNSQLREALDDYNLWLLNHRRHLIVHHRGIVDSKYIQNIGDTVKVGDILKTPPEDLEKYLSVVLKAGQRLLLAVS
jgi:hypothetical protein